MKAESLNCYTYRFAKDLVLRIRSELFAIGLSGNVEKQTSRVLHVEVCPGRDDSDLTKSLFIVEVRMLHMKQGGSRST